MKILTAAQIRDADQFTILNEPVASIDLMERAAAACFKWIAARYSYEDPFAVCCGPGNNGGDGLAIARMLHQNGYTVTVYTIHEGKRFSADFLANKKRLLKLKSADIVDIASLADAKKLVLTGQEVIIDALFGTGLSKPPVGLYARIVSAVNAQHRQVVAIDMPSGLFADHTSRDHEAVIRATHTLSFQLPKQAFFFAENEPFLGKVTILPIGLDEEFIARLPGKCEVIERSTLAGSLPGRGAFAHKGQFGHAAIVAGSYGKMGAAVLATRACLRMGAGLTTAVIPACGYEIIQVAAPEAMCLTPSLAEADNPMTISGSFRTDAFDTLGIGPGIGTNREAQSALHTILESYDRPVILDADALNILSREKRLMKHVPAGSVLTPHPGEFERLAGASADDFDRHKRQLGFSAEHGVVVVLKGKNSCISEPGGHAWFNPTGNPGMAKGGSGDVLTGMITALLAQGLTPLNAALAGVYIHGLAGDLAAKKYGMHSMVATDIIRMTGKAMQYVSGSKPGN